MGAKYNHNDLKIIRTPAILNVKLVKIVPLLIAVFYLCLKEKPTKLLLTKWTHEGIIGYILKKIFGLPYITIVHGSEVLKFKDTPLVRNLLLMILKASDRVIAISRYTKRLVKDLGIENEKVSVVNNSLNLEEYDLDPDSEEIIRKYGIKGKRVLLTVSRLVSRKGHDRVLEVIREFEDEFPNLVYLIVGDGPNRANLVKLIKDYGLSSKVKLLGFVDKGELCKLYNCCDVFIMPSRVEKNKDVEGFGIAFLEANLYGKPVIGGKSGGIPDAIIDGETGLLVDPWDSEDIKEKLVTLLKDEKLRERLGKKGKERILGKLNSELQAQRVAKVLLS